MMKIFRFFYKCAIYADPRFGIYFHTWLMTCGFILFPFVTLSMFFLNRSNALSVVIVQMSIFIGSTFINVLIPDKVAKKITNYLLGPTPVLPKGRKDILIHQLYFYSIWVTIWIIPMFLRLLLDICGYWE